MNRFSQLGTKRWQARAAGDYQQRKDDLQQEDTILRELSDIQVQ